jgi:tetratricopeptide (TPR) repeat protein
MRVAHWTVFGSVALWGALVAADTRAQACSDARQVPGAAAHSIDLEQSPGRLDSRLALAGALMSGGCYGEVVTLVAAGTRLHPRSSELELLLRDARSLQAEQVYLDGLEQADRLAEALAACAAAADPAVALRGCEVALKAGAPDQFAIQKRRGLLLRQQGDNARALDAYLAAARLRRDDRATAAAVAALVDSTGRDDYLTLLAQGAALTTLGRPSDAIRVLRSAQALEPDLSDPGSLLANAERSRTASADDCRRLTHDDALSACHAALLAGAPDEVELLVRTAALLRADGDAAQARTLLRRAATVKPDDAGVAAELARLAPHGARAAETATATLPAASGSRRYSNAEPYGRTH